MNYESLIGGPEHAELRDAIQEGALRFKYKGIPMWKDPFDLAIYSLLLWQEKPQTIIEIGSAFGGSAMWLRDQMLAMGISGMVYSVDLTPPAWPGIPGKPGIRFIQADARNLVDLFVPDEWVGLPRPLLVIEDSSHEAATTLAVLRFFDQHLRPGEMIIVEDGSACELYPGRFPCGGPLAGVEAFVAGRSDYVQVVEYRDAFGHNVTWNPNGYWRKR